MIASSIRLTDSPISGPTPVAQPISVLLVDGEPSFRSGLRTLLNFYSTSSSQYFQVVGEAASMEQALNLSVQQRPALILLDLDLFQDDKVSSRIAEELFSRGKVLVLSAHQDDKWVFRAMQAGACGYLFKDCLATQLYEAITTVVNNQIYLSPEVVTGFFRLFHFYVGRSAKRAPLREATHSYGPTLQTTNAVHLTEREQEILYWLVEGASNAEIAQNLYITVATVKAHLTAIFEKLGVTSRTQAIVKALKLGLVSA